MEVTMLGPNSAPERLTKLVALVYRQAEGKIKLPEEWPRGQECNLP
jgi:hypothetical protein